MVCYEIPLGIAIIAGVMTAGTLNLVDLGNLQSGGIHTWIIFRNPFVFAAFAVYFIAGLAASKRAPFDLPESESELVAGYHTEYSGMRFTLFFFAEYAGMFVVSGIQTALFLGAWNDPFGLIGYLHNRLMTTSGPINPTALIGLNLISAGVFSTKCVLLMLMQMWIRWTFPRPRIDQVLYVCIKVLLPLGCLLLLGAAIWQLYIPERGGLPWQDYQPWKLNDWITRGVGIAYFTQMILAAIASIAMAIILAFIAYSFATGRQNHQRLSHPDFIA